MLPLEELESDTANIFGSATAGDNSWSNPTQVLYSKGDYGTFVSRAVALELHTVGQFPICNMEAHCISGSGAVGLNHAGVGDILDAIYGLGGHDLEVAGNTCQQNPDLLCPGADGQQA